MDKFEAAKDFDEGFRLALFRQHPPGFLPRDSDVLLKHSALFKAGYDYGLNAKSVYVESRNFVLAQHNFSTINAVTDS